jgi:hypothetical protein
MKIRPQIRDLFKQKFVSQIILQERTNYYQIFRILCNDTLGNKLMPWSIAKEGEINLWNQTYQEFN